MTASGRLVLVRHSRVSPDGAVPWHEWRLSPQGRSLVAGLIPAMRQLAPASITSSTERKAVETAELLAAALDMQVTQAGCLRENDRTGLPILSPHELQALLARFFSHPDQVVMGRESANDALARFTQGIDAAISASPQGSVAVVTHGTVTSLFVAAHNNIDPVRFWQQLEMPGLVVLSLPDFQLQPLQKDSCA